MSSAQLPLRPNVCMFITDGRGHLFLGERAGEPGHWQCPQGGLEPGLAIEDNVLRELHEELGLDPEMVTLLAKLDFVHEYEWDQAPSFGKGIWRGQTQQFWAIHFHGSDSDIRFDRHEPAEFAMWRWCRVGEFLERAHHRRVPSYRRALEELEPLLVARGMPLRR